MLRGQRSSCEARGSGRRRSGRCTSVHSCWLASMSGALRRAPRGRARRMSLVEAAVPAVGGELWKLPRLPADVEGPRKARPAFGRPRRPSRRPPTTALENRPPSAGRGRFPTVAWKTARLRRVAVGFPQFPQLRRRRFDRQEEELGGLRPISASEPSSRCQPSCCRMGQTREVTQGRAADCPSLRSPSPRSRQPRAPELSSWLRQVAMELGDAVHKCSCRRCTNVVDVGHTSAASEQGSRPAAQPPSRPASLGHRAPKPIYSPLFRRCRRRGRHDPEKERPGALGVITAQVDAGEALWCSSRMYRARLGLSRRRGVKCGRMAAGVILPMVACEAAKAALMLRRTPRLGGAESAAGMLSLEAVAARWTERTRVHRVSGASDRDAAVSSLRVAEQHAYRKDTTQRGWSSRSLHRCARALRSGGGHLLPVLSLCRPA